MYLKLIYPLKTKCAHPEDGNIFLAIFGAIALVGLLGASVMTFMKGPLATSIRLTKINTAENQMQIGSQVAVMATANQPNNGDCDADGYVEPLEWRVATTEPHPVNGGLVPLSVGISKKDPWGTEYGYCVWNHGPRTSGSGCGSNMLEGANLRVHAVVAVISAGSDKKFTTTCRSFSAADRNSNGSLLDAVDLPLVSKAAETDDDLITTFTYEEATGVSGGLWGLKPTDPGTAIINKKIEATGVADLKGGMLLPDKSFIDCHDIQNAGVMAKSGGGIEICDGAGNWSKIGGSSGNLGTSAPCAVPADAGNVRFNAVNGLPEFCDGTTWRPFTLASNLANLVLTPMNQNAMNVDGANNLDVVNCTSASGFACGAGVTFTVQNQGGMVSANMVISMTNATNFVKTADTCHGHSLPPLGSCTIIVKPKANGNTAFTGNLQITANNNPFAMMQGSATGFGCYPGRLGGGGLYAGCDLGDPDGSYNLIIMPGGCDGSTINPACSGGNDSNAIARGYGGSGIIFPHIVDSTGAWGARQHQNLMAYAAMTATILPAVQYCDAMIYGGYSDWFLPSRTEWDYVQSAFNAGHLSFIYGAYQLSDVTEYMGYGNYAQQWVSLSGAPYYRGADRVTPQMVRCVRRDNLPLPSETADIDPDNVSLTPAIVFSPNAAGTSNTVTVTGIMQPVTVSMTGGTGMDIIRNGVSTNSAAITGVKLNDTLAFKMNGSATIGTKTTATIKIGTDSYTWWTGYADQLKTVKVFVSSNIYNPDTLNGLTGGDAQCTALAAVSPFGLSSSWKMIGSDKSVNAADRIPWNWGRMVNLGGTTIVSGGIADLFDGTLDNPILVDDKGTQRFDSVWTGASVAGGNDGSISNCNNFQSTPSTSQDSQAGWANSSTSSWIAAGNMSCGDNRRIYCIENIDAAIDTTPNAISLDYKIQVPPQSRQISDAVLISGMSAGATQTLTVSATGGTPTFKINGGAEVTSGSIRNGDSIVFLMSAPASSNSSNIMTITAGPVSTKWRVWTGASSSILNILFRTKRVFVTATDPNGANFGGVAGADAVCQSAANSVLMLGTFKAIISGIAESEWAINRVGYNWTELQLVDGTTVAYAGGLWSTLLSPIVKTQTGVTRAAARVHSGTAPNGKAYSSVPDLSNMYGWTGGTCSAMYYQGNSSALSAGITQAYWLCQNDAALYCIEQ